MGWGEMKKGPAAWNIPCSSKHMSALIPKNTLGREVTYKRLQSWKKDDWLVVWKKEWDLTSEIVWRLRFMGLSKHTTQMTN